MLNIFDVFYFQSYGIYWIDIHVWTKMNNENNILYWCVWVSKWGQSKHLFSCRSIWIYFASHVYKSRSADKRPQYVSNEMLTACWKTWSQWLHIFCQCRTPASFYIKSTSIRIAFNKLFWMNDHERSITIIQSACDDFPYIGNFTT